MMRRTLLALPTTLALLLGASLPARAQESSWTYDALNGRWTRGPRDVRAPYDAAPSRGQAPSYDPYDLPVAEPVPLPCEPRRREPAPREREPRGWCDDGVQVGRSRFVERERAFPRRAERCEPAPAPAPRCEPRERTWTPQQQTWTQQPPRQTQPQPQRAVPRAWRASLSPQALLDAHRRLREACDAGARLAVVAELARTTNVTVDQVVVLVAALPTSCERLEALTALHPAVVDRREFHRLYALLDPADQDILHVRITPTYDAETARIQQRIAEERALEAALNCQD